MEGQSSGKNKHPWVCDLRHGVEDDSEEEIFEKILECGRPIP